ncbi:aspartate ammonia-lyase [Candidatus Manganitrophus noduliformans]|uniref:Aspartate ammonia-lyase n=1 Tax=Candidatus Manganitrophus noduliformans TaxID=2606439 RepID=A0A7X6I9C1_9BACT|nr:aspartate ammonia-lyase [Candidatus Manganitrophus noduliformans]NKE69189.1 aspartate ammonia-lyase [Candidatus Manganitrophus noduliformans]
METKKVRKEKDSLGELEVPESAYYGVQTARAVANFPISGLRPHPTFIRASAMIKWAAAQANMAIGKLDPKIGKIIQKSAEEVIDGKWNDQFVVDVFQAGAGTSHNMNTNEVIANRAIEMLGGRRGEYKLVHPNDHVNMSQSTNDVFPTAMRVAALLMLRDLDPVLARFEKRLSEKAKEFDDVIKSGRTHLQDAVPIRLGQEFSGYARAIARSRKRIAVASEGLKELGIGGSAAGTGINTHPDYKKKMVSAVKKISGLDVVPSNNLFERMQSMADFVEISGALRELAVEVIRIANDLRLLSSGPRTGLAEIVLPPVQPGSSIMPGKVNPVMAEMTNMVCFHVIGNDLTITMAAQAGQLELNVMMPVINFNLLQSVEILTRDIDVFTERCIKGITVNRERCRAYAETSVGLATILNPTIGYEAAAVVAKESAATGKPLRDIIIEKGILSPKEVDEILDPVKMTEPSA